MCFFLFVINRDQYPERSGDAESIAAQCRAREQS